MKRGLYKDDQLLELVGDLCNFILDQIVYVKGIYHWYRDGLYSRWGTPSSPGSSPGSKHPGLKGGPLVPGQEPGLKGTLGTFSPGG